MRLAGILVMTRSMSHKFHAKTGNQRVVRLYDYIRAAEQSKYVLKCCTFGRETVQPE